jgi:hypothetical protein
MSLDKLSFNDQIRMNKFISDRTATNKRDHRYYSYRTNLCHACFSQEEDEDHIIQCHTHQRCVVRQKWITALKNYLSRKHTPIERRQGIMQGIMAWMEPMVESDIPLAELVQPQRKIEQWKEAIGWRHFIRRRIPIQWGQLINDH